MTAMNLASRLDPLNLAPAVKTELEQVVQAHIAALQEQAKKDLKAKDAEIHAKDLKIQALTLELAHLRRIRYGVTTDSPR